MQLHVVEYLKTPPTSEQLAELHRQLNIEARAMVRDNEEEYANLDLAQADDATLFRTIAKHPKLLQRPIVVYRDRAIIGRPPERIGDFLERD